jgi:hypothetical protein
MDTAAEVSNIYSHKVNKNAKEHEGRSKSLKIRWVGSRVSLFLAGHCGCGTEQLTKRLFCAATGEAVDANKSDAMGTMVEVNAFMVVSTAVCSS